MRPHRRPTPRARFHPRLRALACTLACAAAPALAACADGVTAPAPPPPAAGAPAAPPPSPPIAPPTTTAPLPTTTYFPPNATDAWETIAPARLGWDTTALNAALGWLGEQRSTAVVILWRGRVVTERYWRGWTPTTDSIIASAGKSMVALMVGQLAEQGRLSIDDPVTRWLGPGWSRATPAQEGAIRVRHLLAMTSGLDDSLRYVVAPGARFYYNNPAYFQLFQVMERASEQRITPLTREALWTPIGMRQSSWVPNVDVGELGWTMRCSARDMARFGLLVLAGGRWDGRAVLGDAAYLRDMLASSSADNPSYGYLWWLNGKASHRLPGPYLLPSRPGAIAPSAPSDLVAALGADDKKIYVVPSLQLVVVRHGERSDVRTDDPRAITAFDEELWRRLRPALRY